jgi:hypothetical protein
MTPQTWLVGLVALALAGCSVTAPINYAPSSVLTASGTVAVSEFRYLPADAGEVAANQIKNTAPLGSIKIDRDVKDLIRNAVFAELRQVGVKMEHPARTLTGEILEFLMDDVGFNVDWTLRIRYTVVGGGPAPTYEAEKVVKRRTDKFVNIFGSLNETIKLNVEELIKDPAFLAAIR